MQDTTVFCGTRPNHVCTSFGPDRHICNRLANMICIDVPMLAVRLITCLMPFSIADNLPVVSKLSPTIVLTVYHNACLIARTWCLQFRHTAPAALARWAVFAPLVLVLRFCRTPTTRRPDRMCSKSRIPWHDHVGIIRANFSLTDVRTVSIKTHLSARQMTSTDAICEAYVCTTKHLSPASHICQNLLLLRRLMPGWHSCAFCPELSHLSLHTLAPCHKPHRGMHVTTFWWRCHLQTPYTAHTNDHVSQSMTLF